MVKLRQTQILISSESHTGIGPVHKSQTCSLSKNPLMRVSFCLLFAQYLFCLVGYSHTATKANWYMYNTGYNLISSVKNRIRPLLNNLQALTCTNRLIIMPNAVQEGPTSSSQ